jgi:excisionase family DNA binding protein
VGRAVGCPAKRCIELGKRPCERRSTLKDANPEQNLLTVEDLGRFFNCGKTKAWQIANSSELRTVRLGRLVRITPEDLDAYIRKNRS